MNQNEGQVIACHEGQLEASMTVNRQLQVGEIDAFRC